MSTQEKLKAIIDKGFKCASIARRLGANDKTLRGWINGMRPNDANMVAKINALYESEVLK